MKDPVKAEDFGAVDLGPALKAEHFGAVDLGPVRNDLAGPVQAGLDKANRFAGEAGLQLASGAIAAPLGGLAGLVGSALPGPEGQGADWSQRVSDMLTFQPRSSEGKAGAHLVAAPFQKLAEVADKAGGAMTDTLGPTAGTAVNTGIQALPLALSHVAGKITPIKESPAALAKRTLEKSQNSGRDAITQASKDAGYVMSPTEVNPTAWNQLTEGLSGQAKTRKTVSLKNQNVTDSLARKALGLRDEAPLVPETFEKLRTEAGKEYQVVRGAGRISADAEYGQALQNIVSTSEGAEASFPTGKTDPVYGLVQSLNQSDFTASAAVDKIKLLRADAEKAYRQGDNRMGKAYKQGALALEDAIDRHLQRKLTEKNAPPIKGSDQTLIGSDSAPMLNSGETGVVPRNPNQVDTFARPVEKDITPTEVDSVPVTSEQITSFRAARERIAKSYSVQGAMDGSHVSPTKLAAQLRKDKPLTGELKTAAEFGKQFPKSAQMIEKAGYPVPEALDLMIGGAAALHNPYLFVAGAARPLVRHGIASDVYQKNFVNPPAYGPNLLPQNLEALRKFQANRGIGLSEMSEEQ